MFSVARDCIRIQDDITDPSGAAGGILMRGRDRWFRENTWPDWRRWDDRAPEWRRLERALWDTGIGINLAVSAALVIADRTGCELEEAWDRLAYNLEHLTAGWRGPE
jgi:hypothetical protein